MLNGDAFPREFPAHFRLMLLAARARSPRQEPSQEQERRHEQDQAQMRALARGPLDWKAFLAVTSRHRVASFVFVELEATLGRDLPEWVHEHLRVGARMNAVRAIQSALETQRICRHFLAAGIDLAGLKGLTLSETVYGDPALRHVGDIDLLTESQDLPGQILLFEQLGYQVTTPACRLTPRRLHSYRRYWKDLTFEHVESGFTVELHWRLFNNAYHPANCLLPIARSSRVQVFGASMRTLSPVDQFLYGAAHGTSDIWIYFKSLADTAAALLQFTPEELAEVVRRARELNLDAQAGSAARLAAEWMGGPPCPPELAQASEPLHGMIRRRLLDRLIREDFTPERSPMGAVDAFRFESQLAPGAAAAIETILRYLWRPRVWSAVDLPDRLFWLYPVLGALIPPRLTQGDAS